MRIVVPPIYERLSSVDEPFDLDSFGRSEFARNLTTLFSGTKDGLVITINSKWGDGKTSFVRLWEQQLERNEKFIFHFPYRVILCINNKLWTKRDNLYCRDG